METAGLTGLDNTCKGVFDHLGFEILNEWYLVGEYKLEGMAEMNRAGRLGDIGGRPNEADLREVEQRVRGIMRV